MSLLSSIIVLAIGYLSGRVTLAVAGLAAVAALVFVILGFAPPSVITDPVAHLITTYYVGNELLFLAGFLFGIAHDQHAEDV